MNFLNIKGLDRDTYRPLDKRCPSKQILPVRFCPFSDGLEATVTTLDTLCIELTKALGLPALSLERYEADDLLATLATQLARAGARVVVVTSDKDLTQLVREDGAYGPLAIADDLDGDPFTADSVDTLLDPADPNTRLYAVESGISQAWAQRLIADLGVAGDLPVSFDRATGAVTQTLAGVAQSAPGTVAPSFHLNLNDVILHDSRIPPWGMDYAEARKRNALPVPPTSYLPSGQQLVDGAVYEHFDDVALTPPVNAVRAEIALLYQTASWEYVQFLWKANAGTDPFLGDVGDDLLEAWRETGMSEPVEMATLTIPEPDATLGPCVALAALAGRRMTRRRLR